MYFPFWDLSICGGLGVEWTAIRDNCQSVGLRKQGPIIASCTSYHTIPATHTTRQPQTTTITTTTTTTTTAMTSRGLLWPLALPTTSPAHQPRNKHDLKVTTPITGEHESCGFLLRSPKLPGQTPLSGV